MIFLSIKDRGASMGGQSKLLPPPWKKNVFVLYGGGGALFFMWGPFCYLNFLRVLDTPPPLTKMSAPRPPFSSVVGNVLLWNAIMALCSHNYPIVIELWEGVPE